MAGPPNDDTVFKALGDSTPRAILDALFTDDGRTTGELAELFSDMTRFGVMKHLRILEDATLITTTREGRMKHHHLNPVPIHAIAGRWLHKYALPVTTAMLGLQRDVEASVEPARAATTGER